MSKLPFVTSDIPRDLRAFIDRVREAFNAKGRDKLITLGDLVDGGVTDGDGDVVTPIDPGGVYGTPPAPTNVATSGALANIIVTWDDPTYYGHSYAEVWGSATNDLGTAVLLGMAPGATYVDAIGSGATRYYWVRFVNVIGVFGPFNNTAGTVGQTAYDPAYLLEVLTDSITTSELSTALNTTISTNTTQITNVRNLYTVKMDNNGYLSGYGLMSTLSDGGVATSDFFINANRFAVTAPMTSMPLWAAGTTYVRNAAVRISGNDTKVLVCKIAGTSGGSAPSIAGDIGTTIVDGSVTWQVASSVPLAVLTTSAILNGNTLAPGVYMDGAFIVNATINNAQIANAAIDDAKIASVSAGKITAGSISVGQYVQSSNYITGSQGWRINGDGTAEFQSVTVRGTIYASAGTIGSAVIGTTYVQSTNYVAGSAGWRLSSNGDFEASNGTFRGSITGASGTFSGSLSSTSGSIGGITISAGGLQSTNYVNGASGWAIAPNGQAQFNQIVIRGSFEAGSIYVGSKYQYRVGATSYDLLSVAATGTVQDLISDTTTPYTNSSLVLYGPTSSGVPLNQRCRNTNTTPLAITINATATVDHFFSLWYSYNNVTWNFLTQIVEPQGGDGSASVTYTTTVLGLSDGETLYFGLSGKNSAGVFQDPGKRYLKYLTVGITAVNL